MSNSDQKLKFDYFLFFTPIIFCETYNPNPYQLTIHSLEIHLIFLVISRESRGTHIRYNTYENALTEFELKGPLELQGKRILKVFFLLSFNFKKLNWKVVFMIDIDIIQLVCNYIGKSAKENASFWRNQTNR